VIVVIGSPIGRIADDAIVAGGSASRVALAAAAAGRAVQLVGRTGDDPTAEAVVLDLARGGVGHVALLRDPSRVTPLEAVSAIDIEPDDLDDTAATPASPGPAVSVSAPPLDAADVDLGIRYLTDFAVVVLAEPASADVVRVVADAARWAAARLILVVAAGGSVPDGLPPDGIVFEAPDSDPDGVFASLVGDFAAALDDGAEPEVAFRASVASDGWSEAAEV
jgi:sugar/nucleoside kinase (ribokinase family)